MARTVFILGAGTSARLGAPLMKDFLRAIRDLHSSPEVIEFERDFQLVLDGYKALQPVYAKIKMNYENDIEELFATFETARILGKETLGGIDPDQLSSSMKKVIAATIETKMRYSVATNDRVGSFVMPHSQYTNFIGLLNQLHFSGRVDSSIAVITFNYDIGLDHALEHFHVPFSYFIEPAEDLGQIPLLKLHGSLNWGVCKKCKSIVPLKVADYLIHKSLGSTNHTNLGISRELKRVAHCDTTLEDEPFIVPPTWNKTELHSRIANIWAQAAKELAEATNIFVVGYSAPPSDQFFKHLLALSLSQGAIIDRFLIANPDNDVYSKFAEMVADPLRSVVKPLHYFFEAASDPMRVALDLNTRKEWNGTWTTQ